MLLLSGCVQDAPSEPVGSAVYPLSEYGERVASCLQDEGWDAIAGFDNSVMSGDPKVGIPPEQLSQYQKDELECVKQLGFDIPRTPSSKDINDMYDREVIARDCMIDLGFDIAEMPSRQLYLETFGTADGWDIVAQVPPFAKEAEYERVWGACPPPLWFPGY